MADRDSAPLNFFFFGEEGVGDSTGSEAIFHYGYQIWVFECLYSYRDHLPETLGKTVRQRTQKSPPPVDTPH